MTFYLIDNIFYEIANTQVYMHFSAKSDCKTFDVISLSIKKKYGKNTMDMGYIAAKRNKIGRPNMDK